MRASQLEHVECGKMLLNKHANGSVQDKDGIALMRASQHVCMKCVRRLSDRDWMETIFAIGMKVNMKVKDGMTALIWASWHVHVHVVHVCVKVLLYKGANCNMQDKITALFLLILCLMSTVLGANGANNANGVVIAPAEDYTTFENSTSTVTFNCSGPGTVLLWTVNGQGTGSLLSSRGIRYTPYISSADGLTVSSQLIVPTTNANSNITVTCTVFHSLYPSNRQSSNEVRLYLQGILQPPEQLKVNISNNTASVSWIAPRSLEVSTPPTISHYMLADSLTKTQITISNPAACKPAMPCNTSFDPSLINAAAFGKQGVTVSIEFSFYAVNGAGNGSVATCTFLYEFPIRLLTEIQDTTLVSTVEVTSNSTNTTSATNLNIIVAIIVPIAFILLVIIVLVITCICHVLRKKNTSTSKVLKVSSDVVQPNETQLHQPAPAEISNPDDCHPQYTCTSATSPSAHSSTHELSKETDPL